MSCDRSELWRVKCCASCQMVSSRMGTNCFSIVRVLFSRFVNEWKCAGDNVVVLFSRRSDAMQPHRRRPSDEF